MPTNQKPSGIGALLQPASVPAPTPSKRVAKQPAAKKAKPQRKAAAPKPTKRAERQPVAEPTPPKLVTHPAPARSVAPPARKVSATQAATQAAVQNVPIQLPPLFEWQKEVWAALHDPAIRFVVCATGQQIGKTSLGVLWCVEGGLLGEDSWWVAPDYSLTEAGYDIMTEIVSQPPFPSVVSEEKKRLRFVFKNAGRSGWTQIRSADDPNKLRSRTLNRIVFDEAALALPDAWHGNLSERITVRRGKALIIFNPHGKNWAWELWRRGDPDNPNRDPEWRSFQFSQYANPNILPEDIEKKRKTMTRAKFQSEVMGDFVDSGGEVFVNVRDQARIGFVNNTVQPDPTHVYVGGLDISGGRHDWHVLVIEDETLRAQVAMIRFSTQELSVMTRTFLDAQTLWNLQGIDGDETTIGIFPMREFQNAGIHIRPVNLNVVSKRLLIESYAAEIELRKIRLLNDPLLIFEHEAYQAEETATGYIRYNSPKGGTDDTVIAGALAHRAATVHDDVHQPAFVRGTHTGLYNPTVKARTYPSWNSRKPAAPNSRR